MFKFNSVMPVLNIIMKTRICDGISLCKMNVHTQVCVCVCVCERERERENEHACVHIYSMNMSE